MIDPLETVINWLKRDAILMEMIGNRIGTKHVPAWKESTCLVVRPDGGKVDVEIPHQPITLDIRAYSDNQHNASLVWQRIVELTRERAHKRIIVSTSNGDAILYYFLQAGAMALLWDTDLSLDFAYGGFIADVSETPL